MRRVNKMIASLLGSRVLPVPVYIECPVFTRILQVEEKHFHVNIMHCLLHVLWGQNKIAD